MLTTRNENSSEYDRASLARPQARAWTCDKLQIERGGVQPHYPQPRISQVEIKLRSYAQRPARQHSGCRCWYRRWRRAPACAARRHRAQSERRNACGSSRCRSAGLARPKTVAPAHHQPDVSNAVRLLVSQLAASARALSISGGFSFASSRMRPCFGIRRRRSNSRGLWCLQSETLEYKAPAIPCPPILLHRWRGDRRRFDGLSVFDLLR